MISGGDVLVRASQDITIQGSVVSAAGHATIEARRDVAIRPGSESSAFSFSRREAGVGFSVAAGNGGFTARAGYHAASRLSAESVTRVAPSLIHGGQGVTITGGRHVTVVAGQITSLGHVDIKAKRGDLAILPGYDRTSSYQSSKEVFAGVSLSVSQNVSGALEQLRQAPATFGSGHGGGLYRAVGAVSGILQGVDGLSQLTQAQASASLMLGASGSRATSAAWSETAVASTIHGRSIALRAGRDMHLVGVEAHAERDFAIKAGRDLVVESALSRSGSSSSSSAWNAGLGWQWSLGVGGKSAGFGGQFGASGSRSGSLSVTHLNSHLTAGGRLSVTTGRDATFAGAVVSARDIVLDVGRNLTVASRQDTAQGSGSSWSLSASFGPGGASGSLGGSRSSFDRAWVSEQTGLFASNRLDVTVKGHTLVEGAVLNSRTGQLTRGHGTKERFARRRRMVRRWQPRPACGESRARDGLSQSGRRGAARRRQGTRRAQDRRRRAR